MVNVTLFSAVAILMLLVLYNGRTQKTKYGGNQGEQAK